ncbi:toll/interleukin-1 receptor domain-containing protein [Actinosynnema sp. NPDC091369]
MSKEQPVLSETGTAGRPLKVFVSYAHDSPRHKDDVRALAGVLEQCGMSVTLDQWSSPGRQDWSSWATGGMSEADYVVVVASPDYKRAGDGLGASPVNRGVQSEAALLRDLLHSDRATWLPRLLPVVLPGHSVAEIPLFLQPYTADHYVIEEISTAGVEDLLRAITRQPAYVRPARGPVPVLPPRSTSTGTGPWAPLSRPAAVSWRGELVGTGHLHAPALEVAVVPVGELNRIRVTVLEALARRLATEGRANGLFDVAEQLAIGSSDQAAWAWAADQSRRPVGIAVLRSGQRLTWSGLPKATLGRVLIRADVVSRIADSLRVLMSLDLPEPVRVAPAVALEPLSMTRIGTRQDLTASSAPLHMTQPPHLRLPTEEEFTPAQLRAEAEDVAQELTSRLFATFRRECR